MVENKLSTGLNRGNLNGTENGLDSVAESVSADIAENLTDEGGIKDIADSLVNGNIVLEDIDFEQYSDDRYHLALYLSKNGFGYIDYLGHNFNKFAQNVEFDSRNEGREIIDKLINEGFKTEVEENIGQIMYIPFHKMVEWFGESDAIRIMSKYCDETVFDCDCLGDDEVDTKFIGKFIDESYINLLHISYKQREEGYLYPDYLEMLDVNGKIMAKLVSHGVDVYRNPKDYGLSDTDNIKTSLLYDFIDSYVYLSFSDLKGLVYNLENDELEDLILFLKSYRVSDKYSQCDEYGALVGELIKYSKEKM